MTKVYVDEPGTPQARVWKARCAVACSRLLLIELRGAIRRRGDEGSLGAVGRGQALAQLASDQNEWLLLDLDRTTLRQAESIVTELPVRALDAIHLATAMRLGGRLPEALHFLTADLRQYEAAQALGLAAELLS